MLFEELDVAYGKTIPKKKVDNDGKHANWGAKLDTNGNQHSWWFFTKEPLLNLYKNSTGVFSIINENYCYLVCTVLFL